MLVQQERTKPRQWTAVDTDDDPKPTTDEEEDEEVLHKAPESGLWDKVTDHFPKVVIVGLICLSALILVVVRNRGETGAILCIESQLSKESEAIPYPALNFRSVKRIVDTSKYATVHSENWIVVAVSGPPTEEVHALAKLPGWKIVAIGGSESPSDWNVTGIIYLTLQQQTALGYRIIPHLPTSSSIRKSVGYLFAIQHGAKKIYDADENASVLGGDLNNAFDLELNGANSRKEPLLQYLSIQNRTCVNPYIHFGQRSVWPRGLPLSLVGNIDPEVSYGQVFSGKQFIQQGLAVGLPDVDSIFYRTRKSGIEPFVINFDSHAPPVALPHGTLAPLNSLNTLFYSTAFWALMLPVSVSIRASDIMRGYWAQRLLWEIGGYLTIHPPSVHRIDRMVTPLYADEKDLHKNVGGLTKFLVSWRSKKSTLFQKALHLSHSMAEGGFWTAQDVVYTAAWLQDLVSVGYVQPRMLASELDRGISPLHHEDHKVFVPVKLPSIHLGVEETTSVGSEVENLIKWRKFYGNIVMVLECSWPINHTALAWKMLYGRMFKSVIMLSEQRDEEFGVEASDGQQSYKSLPEIFEKFPNAEGFLFMKDNVILNYWTLLQADKNKLWNLHKVSMSWKVLNYNKEGSSWYYKSNIKKGVQSVVSELPAHYKATYRANMDKNHFAVCRSNLFYIPRRYVQDFTNLVAFGVKAKLRHELAVPLFFLAMDSKHEFDGEAFSDVVYKPNEGDSAAVHYSAQAHAVYPWKVKNELDLHSAIKAMAAGDPLLLKFV